MTQRAPAVAALVRGRQVAALVAALLVAACSGAPILANPPAERGSPPAASVAPSIPPDPQPVTFPRDDGPHSRLTEWWYYTGHLRSTTGRTFGFEFVVFRAERGAFPVSWASHLALTDEAGNRFLYDQRTQIGGHADASPATADGTPAGFDLSISGDDASLATARPASPWRMTGANGRDHLSGASTAGFGLELSLATDRPPVLHDTVGFVSFGEAGGSYYYSRPRMDTTGTITLDRATLAVTGKAWFDHQWGDFISVGGGGWDWFAVNLANGTDLTLSLVRDASGAYPLVYGTIVAANGSAEHLGADAFSVARLGAWTSARTGATYPAGWRIDVPGRALTITLQPTVADQELDSRPSTGVVYWEGSQRVSATENGQPVGGEAYVELTGYGPSR